MQSSQSMKAFVTGLLKDKLSPFYYYHNVEHTLYVTGQATAIGIEEKCTAAEIDLLEAAALWHDTGFIIQYNDHEEESCRLARQYLPGFGYAMTDTDRICGMIMATKMPQSPQNKLEFILADADLEYLGTGSAGAKATELFKELQYQDPSLTRSAWNDFQIAFLIKHHYFTRFCKENRAFAKREYLNGLLNGIE
jgi:uncharacterized protein